MRDVKILVIIVTYNGSRFVKKCIAPVYGASPDIDVLVVDNASSDDTVGLVGELFPDVNVICNSENAGFGAANNIGFRYAIEHGYDYVYLLNQDARISADGINELVRISLKYPQYGIVSPLQVYDSEKELDKLFASRLSDELIDDCLLDAGNIKEIYPTKNDRSIQAAHWLLDIKVIKKTGGFSPTFFHYGEDVNYCNRVRFLGYELGIVPSVRGVHDRKGRVEQKDKSLFFKVIHCKNILSNPNLSKKARRSLLKRSLFSYIPDYKFNTFRILGFVIKDIRKINANRIESLSEGAFL